MLGLSSEFCLTGFVQPGKPGIICVEGTTRNCQEWWSHVKSWNWQRINVKITEELETESRLFSNFEEIGVLKNTERSNLSSRLGRSILPPPPGIPGIPPIPPPRPPICDII